MRFVPLVSLFLAACASSSGLIDSRVLPCGSGQEIEVNAGLADPTTTRDVAGPLQYVVEVANNGHAEVTVTSIRIAPRAENAAGFEEAYKAFDQVIPGGEDHLFELPANDGWVRSADFDRRIRGERLEFVVTVSLSNGDSYRCAFAQR